MASKKGKKSKKGKLNTKVEKAAIEETAEPNAAAETEADEASEDSEDEVEAAAAKESSDEPVEKRAKKEPAPPSRKPPKSKGKPGATGGGKAAGVLAVFDQPDTTLEAAKQARDRGFEKWDVYTPFPVHGMDEAMGLDRSPVPWITFIMGVVGFASAIIIQFGTMVYSWPLNFGGKPYAAWPSFVPITFEMTVFFAGVSTAIGSLFLGGVLKFRKRKPHPAITSHRFAIFVEASDPKYDEGKTLSLFEQAGAIEVRAVKEGE